MAVTPTDITGLNVLDNFAVKALGFLIQKYESTSIPVDEIVSRAYDYAESMRTRSADLRAAGDIGSDSEVSIVKGGQNSASDSALSYTNALQVAIVAGGGGGSGGSTDVSGIVNTLQYTDQGTSNVITLVNRINRLLDILGYYPGSPDATLNSTQHKDLKDLISTIANVNGPFMRDDAEEASALVLNNISDLVVFADWDYVGSNRPFRVPISNFDSRYGLVLKVCSDNQFPATADTKPGYYYKLSGSGSVAVLNSVVINLPSLTIADGKPLKIIMFNFSCTALLSGGTVPFSVNIDGVAATSSTLKFRGSNPGSAIDPGTYEVDCVHNGSYWLMSLTKIVN